MQDNMTAAIFARKDAQRANDRIFLLEGRIAMLEKHIADLWEIVQALQPDDTKGLPRE
jgi:hypothetical protein